MVRGIIIICEECEIEIVTLVYPALEDPISMFTNLIRFSIVVCAVALPYISAAEPASNGDARVTVRPNDTGEALINPDMGWMMHFYSNVPTNYGSKLEPSDSLDWFPGCSTVFLRIPWAYVEPEEGKFNWAILDTPAQRWISKGKCVAFRITCSENWIRYATPEWVKKAGAKGVFYEFGKGPSQKGELWDPDFGDPVFLKKLDNFLDAMGKRYDGNPDVAFVDVGSYGLWGEGHTMMSSQVPQEKANIIVRKHIDLYKKHFPHTQLFILDDVIGPETPGRHFPLMDYAISQGLSLRDDSILVQPAPKSWFHSELAQEFWPKTPVALEHEHYGPSKARGAWDDSLLLKSVEDYHASYMSIHFWPQEEYEGIHRIVDRINMRMGYRLRLVEMTWPKSVRIGEEFSVESKWGNGGVAPCYPGGFMCLTLKDAKGGIVSCLSDESLNMWGLQVGPADHMPVTPHTSQFRIGFVAPTTLPGTYDMYVSVGKRDGTPVIALPLEGNDGQRRYKVGSITIE